MKPPGVPSGALEQAIYTWSTHNLTGVQGQSYGAASPILARHIDWLSTLPTAQFSMRAPGMASASTPYAGWLEHVSIGCFPVSSELTVVYRKTADGGLDGAKRRRTLVQMLVGRSDEFDISAVSLNGEVWLDADACQLDRLPKLAQLKVEDIEPLDCSHACDAIDELAKELTKTLASGAAATIDDPSTNLVVALLAAVPDDLRSNVNLSWFVSESGPVCRVKIDPDAPGRSARSPATGLSACQWHEHVSSVWSQLAPERKIWSSFALQVMGSGRATAAAGGAINSAISDSQFEERADAPSSGQIRFDILTEMGIAEGQGFLTEVQLNARLSGLQTFLQSRDEWWTQLEAIDVRRIFGCAESRSTFARINRFMSKTGVPTSGLLDLWRTSSVAGVGYALLRRPDVENVARRPRWLATKRLDLEQVTKLAQVVFLSDPSGKDLGRMLNAGLAQNTDARRAVLDGLDLTPRVLYRTVLPELGLQPRWVQSIVRDDIDGFADAFEIAEAYRPLLQQSLSRRPLIGR